LVRNVHVERRVSVYEHNINDC